MTRVDFYVLPEGRAGDPERIACRLAEKAYGMSHRVYLLVDSTAAAERLDELLWTFRDGSFVPHAIAERGEGSEPVLIGTDPARSSHTELLINVTDSVPADYRQYARVAELVGPTAEARARGRERFRYYREQDCQMETHRL